MNYLLRIFSCFILLAFLATSVALASTESTPPWKDPHKRLEKPNYTPQASLKNEPGPVLHRTATINEVDQGVYNLRALLGGGRKLSRHDCPVSADNLEGVWTRDIGFPNINLHSGLSGDNGAGWNVVGPLGLAEQTNQDRSHCIGWLPFGELTLLGYQERDIKYVNGSMNYTVLDAFGCLQAFGSPNQISDETLPYDEFFLQQAITSEGTSDYVYWSFIDFNAGNPYTTYFRSSTDGGTTWSDYVDFNAGVSGVGFDMGGTDGALSMDAQGDFVGAFVPVILDSVWALANGFNPSRSYPGYSQSTDGGATWSDVELLWGADINNYPQGHSGDPIFDATLYYVNGIQGKGLTAFNNIQDNCAVTDDGKIHLTYTMDDTTVGYVAVFHSVVDGGTITNEYVGFPENPLLEAESGVAALPSISKTHGNAVVVGWTEFMQGSGGGSGDICYNVIQAGEVAGTGPVNATQDADDETYQRIADYTVPIAPGSEDFYVDWLFLYYDAGTGNAADSTLWHAQAVVSIPGGAGIGDGGPGIGIPKAFALGQNYPNPFNPSTAIGYELPERANVSLKIYDLRGRLVDTLVEGVREAGQYSVQWNGTDSQGKRVSSGIYLYTMEANPSYKSTKKMVILK